MGCYEEDEAQKNEIEKKDIIIEALREVIKIQHEIIQALKGVNGNEWY